MRGPVLAGLIFGLCGVALPQTLRFAPLAEATVLERFADPPAGNQERQARIKELFLQAGCTGQALTEQTLTGAETADIICRLKGRSDKTMIVGAPYYEPAAAHSGQGNWSAAALLASLYQALNGRKRHHTILFVAFAGSGDGHAEEAYAARMSAGEVKHTDAVLILSALGLSPAKVWTHHSDKDLVQKLMDVTYLLKLPLSQVEMADSNGAAPGPFAARHIPQITVHSFTSQDLDSGAAFRPGNYMDTYRLLGGFLAYLDETKSKK